MYIWIYSCIRLSSDSAFWILRDKSERSAFLHTCVNTSIENNVAAFKSMLKKQSYMRVYYGCVNEAYGLQNASLCSLNFTVDIKRVRRRNKYTMTALCLPNNTAACTHLTNPV